MEMHDLPIRAAFCDDERDTTNGTKRLFIAYPGHSVQTRNDNGCIRQSHRYVIPECRASWPVVQKRILEVSANTLWFDHDRLAARAEEQCIRSVKPHDAINVRIREGLGPFLQDLKGLLLWTCDCDC